MKRWLIGLAALVSQAQAASFTTAEATAYPYVSELVAARSADRIAWVRTVKGVRNVWTAAGPAMTPVAVTHYAADDGQELTNLALSPDGTKLAFVRGGDHDGNWPAKGNLAPNPESGTVEQKVTLWVADLAGAKPPVKVGDGDEPAVSATGTLAYLKDGQVWTAKLDGTGARRLFFDRGKDGGLKWSPDGSRLAFQSNRGDHAFIGVYAGAAQPLTWLAPSSGWDEMPTWSRDGGRLAFTRRAGRAGAPEPLLTVNPEPWAIWTADAASGAGAPAWTSPRSLRGSYPETAGQANLHWLAGGRIAFLADLDNWPHLYTVPEAGGRETLLTPGDFMVEHVAESRDGTALLYSANTGTTADDGARRHIFRVNGDGGAAVALTGGEGIEWTPVATGAGVAFVGSEVTRPPAIEVAGADGKGRRVLAGQAAPPEFAGAKFVTPRDVTFKAADGTTVHGQLFIGAGSTGSERPGLIFVHGGPPRQMLVGWHYMGYYSHAYAMNQFYADHGYAVLSVNYRLGVGYGHDFHHPDKAGAAGASEYQDVVAGAKFLQKVQGIDGKRIGIWGGSYGGYLTALALARDSALFKAGVDLHGVHDWSRLIAEEVDLRTGLYERGDIEEATKVAWKSSPDADVATWTSPVLLIHGDDDRNVKVNQTIDLSKRLAAKGVRFEELIIPDDIHDFLRYANWRKADAAAAGFLARELGGEGE